MNDEPEITGVDAPVDAAMNAPPSHDGDEVSLVGGATAAPIPAAAPAAESCEAPNGESPTLNKPASTSPRTESPGQVSPALAGPDTMDDSPVSTDRSAADRTTRVQGGPETGWCPRCGMDVPTRGFCPVCGSQTGPLQPEKLITRARKLDAFLGFVYFWACYALTVYVPSLLNERFPSLAVGLGLLLFCLVPVTAIVVFTQPRFGYRAFGRGIAYGAISFGVLILGAFLTCIGLSFSGALKL